MKPTKAEIVAATVSLCSFGWLSGADPDFRETLLSGCQWEWYVATETISHGGDTFGGIFGLAIGAVSVIPALGVADAPIIHIATAPFGTGPIR